MTAAEERDLRITADSGAYVAVVTVPAWTLTGYGADGERLGELALDHLGADR